ncbi:hypothetical protein, partial [Bacillus cereus group sp. BC257]|uniref:hypothetical protein n=1 Tax=Bacillus cereus group sp. BC257 TaxID=3445326 RepID=UPI003F246A5C
TIAEQRTSTAAGQHRGVAFIPSAPAPAPAPVSEALADEIAAGWAKARAKHETAAPATAEPGTPDAVAAAGWNAARAKHGFGPIGEGGTS